MQIDGLSAINPVNQKEVPVWVSDYVLMSYGTGAIMAVPGHDERDWEFAKKFGLPIIQVVAKNGEEVDINEAAFTDVATGVLINSDFLNGLEVKDAKNKMLTFLEENGIGTAKVNYKLRDWVFSDSATGASRSPSFTATSAVMCLWTRVSCRCSAGGGQLYADG